MNTKNILIVILIVVVGAGIYWYATKPVSAPETPVGEEGGIATPEEEGVDGKLKADVFTGPLEEVYEGCYVDGECYVVVGGRHVTVVMGWSQEIAGSLRGVESFGDLNSHIGEEFEVYAQDKSDGTYTLYGSEGFYIELK